jgi:hypothetical protein
VAFPSGSSVGDYIFFDDMLGEEINTDLQELFGFSNENITDELWYRFDGLPIHKLVYYQSYKSGVFTDPYCCNKHEIGSGSDITQ